MRNSVKLLLPTLLGEGCLPTYRIDGAVADNAAFTHPADTVLAWTQVALPAAFTQIRFRRTDASNYILLQINSAGNLTLQKIVGGSTTQIDFAGGAGTTGRYAVLLNGQNIKVYLDGAVTPIDANAPELVAGTNGVWEIVEAGNVTDFKVWPLACKAQEGV